MCAIVAEIPVRDRMNVKQKFSRRKFVCQRYPLRRFPSYPARKSFWVNSPGYRRGSTPAKFRPTDHQPGGAIKHFESNESAYAKLRNVPVHAVTIESGFWSPRRKQCDSSIPSWANSWSQRRMDNFLRLPKKQPPQRGPSTPIRTFTNGLKQPASRAIHDSPNCVPRWTRTFARLLPRSKRTAT